MNDGAKPTFVLVDEASGRQFPVWEGQTFRWELQLPWSKPPMSLNDRDHYQVKRRKTAMIRNTTHLLVKQAKIPALRRCSVQLWYAPTDRRRRDADNLAPVAKACCDGVVDAGVVRDDTPDLMVKPQSLICDPERGGRLWLVVTDLSSEVAGDA